MAKKRGRKETAGGSAENRESSHMVRIPLRAWKALEAICRQTLRTYTTEVTLAVLEHAKMMGVEVPADE